MKYAVLAAALGFGAVAGQDPPTDDKLKAWVEQLGAVYENERTEARKALEAAGAKAERFLVDGIGHSDYRVRRGCLELLAKLDSPAAVEKASAIFRSKKEDRSVQVAAFEYLKRHGAKAEDVFIEALDSPEEAWRLGAVEALTAIKSTRCVDKAAALFDRETVKAIKDKAFALLQACGPAARPHFLRLLANPDIAVRLEALRGLKGVVDTKPEELLEPLAKALKLEVNPQILDEAFEIYGKVGPKAEPYLIEGLRSPSDTVRQRCLEGLMAAESEKAIGPVAELFRTEPNDNLRTLASTYLVQHGLKSEDALIPGLESKTPRVRIETIRTLARIRSEKVYDRIAELYRTDKNAELHLACFEYLENLGLRAEKELLHALKEEDLGLRRRAIRALGFAQSEKAVVPLMDLLQDLKPEIKQAAREALATIGPKAIEAVTAAVEAKKIKAEDANEVFALYFQTGVEKILDALVSADCTIGSYPGQFEDLARFGKERALPVLWKMVADPDYVVRFRDVNRMPPKYGTYLQCLAIMALGELGDPEVLKQLKGISFPPGEDRHREHLVALHRLGEKGPLEGFVAQELKECEPLLKGEERIGAYRRILNAALLQARVGRREEALAAYARLVAAVEASNDQAGFQDFPTALYNTACLLATLGRKGEAVAALVRAVEAGFRDLDWINKDKELDPIRGEEGFKKLVGDPEKFKPK
jgi:HEAT repeat protein